MGVRRLQRALCSVEGPADASLYAIPGATPLPVRNAHTSVAGHEERLRATYRETAPLYNPRTRLSGPEEASPPARCRSASPRASTLARTQNPKFLLARRFYKMFSRPAKGARSAHSISSCGAHHRSGIFLQGGYFLARTVPVPKTTTVVPDMT